MSAKEITIYIPHNIHIKPVLEDIVTRLGLKVDDLTSKKGFSFDFSAQIGEGANYFLLEYKKDDLIAIREIRRWRKPSEVYKKIIMNCRSSITIYYREPGRVKDALMIIGDCLADLCKISIMENGYGCLLTLDSIIKIISNNREWSWEKNEFPEVPGVAASEWI